MAKTKNSGYYVGCFTESDLQRGVDKAAVQAAMRRTGLQYVNTKLTKKGLKIWVVPLAQADMNIHTW